MSVSQETEEEFDARTRQTAVQFWIVISCCILCCAALGWFAGARMNAPGSQTHAMTGAAAMGLCSCLYTAFMAAGWAW